MKRLCLVALLVLGAPQLAWAQLTCGQLTEVADSLDNLSYAMEGVYEIPVNSQLDQQLDWIATALNEIAYYQEGDAMLAQAAAYMINGWETYDLDQFHYGLDMSVDGLDRLWDRDCAY